MRATAVAPLLAILSAAVAATNGAPDTLEGAITMVAGFPAAPPITKALNNLVGRQTTAGINDHVTRAIDAPYDLIRAGDQQTGRRSARIDDVHAAVAASQRRDGTR